MKESINLAELILKIAQNPISIKKFDKSKFTLFEENNLNKDDILFLKNRKKKSVNDFVSEQLGKDKSVSIAQGGGGGGCNN